MFTMKMKTSSEKTEKFLHKILSPDWVKELEAYAQRGVDALSSATPIDTGNTAASWRYDIVKDRNGITITWSNTNINKGVNIALILQYGHGTGWGTYVQGRDYINPALQPIFNEISEKAREVIIG